MQPDIVVQRFELIFMNPTEHRWQIFQERPLSTESEEGPDGYQQQAQKLLASVRKWVTEFLQARPDLGAGVLDQRVAADISVDLSVTIRTLLKSCGNSALRYYEFMKTLKGHYRETRALQGLPERHFKPLWDAFDQIEVGERKPLIISTLQALDFIAATKVSSKWDIFGRLALSNHNGDDNDNVPYSAATIRYLSYDILVEPGPPRNETEAALGYPVDLHIRWPTPTLLPDSPIDELRVPFHKFCNPVENPTEQRWYCFFANMMDALNPALSKGAGGNLADSAPSHEPKGSTVICFPIRVCGYDHFLQMHLNDRLGGKVGLQAADSLARALADSHIGQLRSVVLFKECLRELLVQMHIAAFQYHIGLKLRQEASRQIKILTAGDVGRLFAEFAPNLVRVNAMAVRVADRPAYFYCYCGRRSVFEVWNRRGGVCEDCQRRYFAKGDAHIARVEERFDDERITVEAYLPWEERFDGPMAHLFVRTGQQRLQERLHDLCFRIRTRNRRAEMLRDVI